MRKQNCALRSALIERTSDSKIRKFLAKEVVWRPVETLQPFPDNPRRHPDAQIKALMRSISRIWTIPILIDENCVILAGHGRLEAAKQLHLASVPTLMVQGLTTAEKRAIVIADNKLPEHAVWDFDLLKGHLKDLISTDFDVELTGFSAGEIDILIDGNPSKSVADPDDELREPTPNEPAVSVPGDIWAMGRHRIICGDARSAETYRLLLGADVAQMVVADPPFNVKIDGHARGRSKKRHREFAMASGEMSEAHFTAFLETAVGRAIQFSEDGSVHYWFMDWRHFYELLRAGRSVYSEFKNLLVWNKSNAGQGSFYRSKHELIAVFKSGNAPHINNFGLGAAGRYRTNVLDYPGGSSFSAQRREELEIHPTVKPVALIADLIRDCSRRNGIVLDPFSGSGTLVLAADRTGRVARMIEIDPIYVDVTIGRWERATGGQARHAETGKTFAETKRSRHRRNAEDPPPVANRATRATRR